MLTQEQIDFYQINGYIVVENVISAKDIAELRRVTDEYVDKSREVTEHTNVLTLNPDIRQNHLNFGVSKIR